jgi:hypothetical protein
MFNGIENRNYGCRGSAALTMRHFSIRKLALALPTSGGRSVGIVRSRLNAMEFRSLVQHLHLIFQDVTRIGI